MFETYLRPSEVLAPTALQLVPPILEVSAAGSMTFLAIFIRANELGIPGKTGEFDVSVCLVLARHDFLLPLLRQLHTSRAPNQLPLSISYGELSSSSNRAIALRQLGLLGLSLYGLRHGNASHDRATGSRSLADVQ
jgi:hypothetical protein